MRTLQRTSMYEMIVFSCDFSVPSSLLADPFAPPLALGTAGSTGSAGVDATNSAVLSIASSIATSPSPAAEVGLVIGIGVAAAVAVVDDGAAAGVDGAKSLYHCFTLSCTTYAFPRSSILLNVDLIASKTEVLSIG